MSQTIYKLVRQEGEHLYSFFTRKHAVKYKVGEPAHSPYGPLMAFDTLDNTIDFLRKTTQRDGLGMMWRMLHQARIYEADWKPTAFVLEHIPVLPHPDLCTSSALEDYWSGVYAGERLLTHHAPKGTLLCASVTLRECVWSVEGVFRAVEVAQHNLQWSNYLRDAGGE